MLRLHNSRGVWVGCGASQGIAQQSRAGSSGAVTTCRPKEVSGGRDGLPEPGRQGSYIGLVTFSWAREINALSKYPTLCLLRSSAGAPNGQSQLEAKGLGSLWMWPTGSHPLPSVVQAGAYKCGEWLWGDRWKLCSPTVSCNCCWTSLCHQLYSPIWHQVMPFFTAESTAPTQSLAYCRIQQRFADKECMRVLMLWSAGPTEPRSPSSLLFSLPQSSVTWSFEPVNTGDHQHPKLLGSELLLLLLSQCWVDQTPIPFLRPRTSVQRKSSVSRDVTSWGISEFEYRILPCTQDHCRT